jgi:outer membrane protein
MSVFTESRPRARASLATLVSALLWFGVAGSAFAQARGAASAGDMRAVTIDEAVQLAQAASPLIVRAEGQVQSAAAARRTSKAAFLPTLSLESNSLQASNPSPVGQPGASIADGTSALGLTTTWDLFTAGRRGAERRRTDAASMATESQLTEQKFAVVVQAKQSYFEVLRSGDLVKVAQARVQRAQDGLAQAKHRHDAGTATLSDELRAQLELSDAQQTLLQAQAALQVSYYALGRTVGSDGPVTAKPAPSLEPKPLPLSRVELLELIVNQAPSVRSADATARAVSADIAVARARYMPSLQLTGGSRWLAVPGTRSLGERPIWDLRLGLFLPLFDGLQREEAVVRARSASESADADARDRRRAIRVDAERALTALDLAAQRITLLEGAVLVAREDLRVQEARYRAGASTILERVTSQANLANAEAALVTVRYDYQVARAQIEALAGRSF